MTNVKPEISNPKSEIGVAVVDPKYAIAWQGAVEALHSLALVNRAICSRLARRGHRVTLVRPDSSETPSGALGELPGPLGVDAQAFAAKEGGSKSNGHGARLPST